MSFEFSHIDDYQVLIPREKQREGNDFKALIDVFFPEDNDLIFCLIEKVTLSDLDAIGETYLYSAYTKAEGNLLLKKYTDIIKTVRNKFDFSLSEHLDWYKRNSFILQKKNDVGYLVQSNNPSWLNLLQEDKRDRDSYGKLMSSSLTDDIIQDYLKLYASLLHSELGFKEFPNYCIIVRPISVIEGRDIIPLGNIYLHFATTTNKDCKFYLRLINDFLIVWFKRKGVKIIKEIQFKTIEEFKKKESQPREYLPKFDNLHGAAQKRLSRKLHPSNKSLEEYYDDLFMNEDLKASFELKLRKLKEKIIPDFIKLEAYLKDKNINNLPNLDYLADYLDIRGKLFGIQGQSILKETINRDHFIKTLIRREIFKIGILVFNFPCDIIRNILQDNELSEGSQSYEAEYTYLWTELFIPWSKNLPSNPIKAHLKCTSLLESSLSIFEKRYIADCKLFKEECISLA